MNLINKDKLEVLVSWIDSEQRFAAGVTGCPGWLCYADTKEDALLNFAIEYREFKTTT